MRALFPLTLCAISFASTLADAQQVNVPPVTISTLTHGHFDAPTSIYGPVTASEDTVAFPCGVGACNGPGFTTTIGGGDLVTMRFQAPAGKRFAITRQPGSIQRLVAVASWSTGSSAGGSGSMTSTHTFENLTGPAPTLNASYCGVSSPPDIIHVEVELFVSADCAFTAWQVQFTASGSSTHQILTYNAVNSTWTTSWGCQAYLPGQGGPDVSVMRIEDLPIAPVCLGDGTGGACPCGNSGFVGRGCANSVPSNLGALLTATGTPSISADSVTLTCSGMTGPGLFFNASGLGGPSSFGDGLLCASVGIVRMGVVFPTGNTASYPGGLTPNPVHVAGGIASPGNYYTQCWYRDSTAFCTLATNNLSNGLRLQWGL